MALAAGRTRDSRCATGGGQRRLELNSPDGRECLRGGLDAGDAIDAITAELSSVVDYEQDDVDFAGAYVLVRFDDSRARAALLGPIVDLDTEAVGAGVAEQFQREASSPARDRARRRPVGIEVAQLRSRKVL
jgi:hypothetical protein